jgi:RNA polymerase sigma-70 factor (ECF subfamily)
LIDDLTQDTYVKICANNFKALRTFDFRHENALFGFLKVMAANVAEDYIRSSHSQKRGQGRDDEDFDQTGSAGPSSSPEPIERKILMNEIKKCLQEHSADPNFARDYAIFWLYYRQGLTAKEIADLPSIGLTVKGVESTLLRLTRMLRDKLGRHPGRKRASGV